MIPIHYFLALMALLVSLSGCTQKAPPGTRQMSTSNNTTGITKSTPTPTPEPVQTIRPNDDVIHPSSQPEVPETTIALEQPNGAKEWKLILKGADADRLYKIMTIKTTDPDSDHRDLEAVAKTGKHLDCYSLNKGASQCELLLEGATGELKIVNKKLSHWKAEEELKESFSSDYLVYDSQNNSLKFSIRGEEAKKIFEAMNKAEESILIADENYAEGKRRKGINVDCYLQFQKSSPEVAIHTCNLWFKDSLFGEFDIIL